MAFISKITFFITVIISTSTLIVGNTHKESQKGKGTLAGLLGPMQSGLSTNSQNT